VKKTKNVIDFEIQKYKLILEELQTKKTSSQLNQTNNHSSVPSATDDVDTMDEDLTKFIAEII
jgi:hypothetical protein